MMPMYDLNFTDADLKANRAGYLTEKQRENVQSMIAMNYRNARYTVLFFAVFVPILMVVGLFIELDKTTEALSEFLPKYAVVALVPIGFTLVVSMIGLIDSRQRSRNAREEIISTVEGPVRLVIAPKSFSNRYAAYNLEVRQGRFKKMVFRFSNDRFARYFVDGEEYRVYYIRYAPLHLVLSVERV